MGESGLPLSCMDDCDNVWVSKAQLRYRRISALDIMLHQFKPIYTSFEDNLMTSVIHIG